MTSLIKNVDSSFNPINWTLDSTGTKWEKTSFLKKIWRSLVDHFNSDAKWVTLAQSIKTYSANKLEREEIVSEEEYEICKRLSKLALDSLEASPQIAKPALHPAVLQLKRNNIALAARQHYAADSADRAEKELPTKEQLQLLKEKIEERLGDEKAHFWCIDFHSDKKSSKEWFNGRWQEVSDKVAEIPGLTDLLLEHSALLEEFINWSFRDNCPVEIFAAFPALTDLLKPIYAAGRIGRASENGQHLLQIHREKGKCYVTIHASIPQKDLSFVPGKEFFYGNGLSITPEAFAKALVDRYDDYIPDFQLTQKGIIPFHAYNLGAASKNPITGKISYSPVSTDEVENWWAGLPDKEEMTLEEAQKRCEGLTGKNPGIIVHGTTDNPELEVVGNHGYIEILLPHPKIEGKYLAYQVSRTAKDSPHGILQSLNFLGKTTQAAVVIHDQSEDYSNRQNWGVGFALGEDQVLSVKKLVLEYVKKCNKGILPYSLFAKNCHALVHHIAKKLLTEKLSKGEAFEMEAKLDKLMVLSFTEPLLKKSSNPLFELLIRITRSGKVSYRMGHRLGIALRAFGAGRTFDKGEKGKTSVITSHRLQRAEFYLPSKIRPLAQDAIKAGKVKYHAVRNRIYIPNGRALLETLDVKGSPK